MTPYKGEFGRFAAYVRTRRMSFLCTHVRSDCPKTRHIGGIGKVLG